MHKLFILLLFTQFSAGAQPKTKKVLIEGEGIPVLMLNGGTSDMTVFAAHSKELSHEYKVIRMEQFNIQYAAENRILPGNYSVRMESEAIKHTLDSLHIKEPVIVVGHSYGGVIAFDFALHHPDLVKSLVLIEPPLSGIAAAKHESPEGMKEMHALVKEFTPHAEITEALLKQFRCGLMNCDSINIYQHPLWPVWLKQKNRLRGLFTVGEYKINLKKIQRFHKPVLIITGTGTVPYHTRIDALLANEFPLAKTASLPGGHASVYSHPDEFIKILLQFIR